MKFTEKYPNETVRALSWKQPFASLMLQGKVETRVWDSKYFGWVLICASKAPYSHVEVQNIAGGRQYQRITDRLGFEFKSSIHVPLGQAIAIGKLVRSISMDSCMINQPLSHEDNRKNKANYDAIAYKCFVEPQSGLWMHEYTDVQPIVRFEWKGKQGWCTLDEETKDKIILL